jgi:Holliday junction resolvasome RuvABC endonuclease subunit
MKLASLDYSMTSPAICVFEGETWNFSHCKFYFFIKSKFAIKTDQLISSDYPEYETQQERFAKLAQWSLDILQENDVKHVFIEGYSMGSKSSSLFQIGENTGTLKHYLWKSDISFDLFAPTSVKKYATGKGNAPKDRMWEAFLEETDCNIFHILGLEQGKSWNPVSDIVDAYYICKMGFEKS